MPALGDFLGALLGELASARLHADVETLRVADVYANHELLKHLPVPRFRLPEVRLDLPAIIEAGDEQPQRVDVSKVKSAVVATVRSRLADSRIGLTRVEDTQLARDIGSAVESALLSTAPPPARSVADRIVQTVRYASRSIANEEGTGTGRHDAMLEEMAREVSRQIVLARATASRINILPHTGAVREVPDSDRLVRLHLLISEESVEWTVIETMSGPKERLVLE